jgi:murein DD-endopeptidase MepM/ murein hydrolase activator NlpD
MLLRVVAAGIAVVLLWTFGASRAQRDDKLALAAIVPGAVMTQPFGCSNLALEPFDPYCPSRHVHTGVDLAAKEGTPVHAAAAGVASVGFDPGGAGLYVAVVAEGHVRELYCHLSLALVVGTQQVRAGQVIGDVGSTGLSTGPHLHFEVQVDGRAVDPVIWLAS